MMGFHKKKFGWRVGGWGKLYPIFLDVLNFFLDVLNFLNFSKPLIMPLFPHPAIICCPYLAVTWVVTGSCCLTCPLSLLAELTDHTRRQDSTDCPPPLIRSAPQSQQHHSRETPAPQHHLYKQYQDNMCLDNISFKICQLIGFIS